MSLWLNFFLFGIYPYLALAICILGCCYRFYYNPYSCRSGSSELAEKKILSWASPLFHAGILCILLGHLIGFLTPPLVEKTFGITSSQHLLLASAAGGFFALFAFIGGTGLLWRRLTDKTVKSISHPLDLLILILIYLQLLLGMAGLPHAFHAVLENPAAQTSTMDIWGEWIRGGLLFQPSLSSIILPLPWIYKLHVLNGLTLIMLVPFSRLIHVLSAPFQYLFRTGYQIVRKKM